MALKITEECINCDMCVAECPNDAISLGETVYQIDCTRCTECIGHYDEPSCVQVCPVDSIIPDPKHRESLAELAERYTSLHC